MIEGYLTVSKEDAKRMIDAAPGDSITIVIFNLKIKYNLF